MTDLHEEFRKEVAVNIARMGADDDFNNLTSAWMKKSIDLRYSYNFSSLGRPIIQYPTDMVATQELIWSVRPDLIIDTGIAHGGSAIMNASCLALLDYCDAVDSGNHLDPKASKRKVLALDIDIRNHQKKAISSHPMAHHIDMLEGSSIDKKIISQVYKYAKNFQKVLVCLDSDHTHSHVLEELKAYAPLVSKGSYCIVWDGIIEDLPEDAHPNRRWAPGNSPKTALHEYLSMLEADKMLDAEGDAISFEIDKGIENKIAVTVAPSGYLKRV